jgi:hypothetical protein
VALSRTQQATGQEESQTLRAQIGERLPSAGERPVEGDAGAPGGNSAGTAQDRRRSEAPSDHVTRGRRSDGFESHRAGRGDPAARDANSAFYVAHIEADSAKLKEAGDMKLLAGMPVEVYIEGEQRTVLQYLMEPLTQVVQRAGRER